MLTGIWGSRLAQTVAAMIVARPDLGRRLSLAPRRVVHAIAIHLYRALDASCRPLDMAEAVEHRDVRDLLLDAMPGRHPMMFGVLDRAGARVRSPEFYERLNTVLGGPAADIVTRAELIGQDLIDIAERVSRDPVLLAARHAFGHSRSNVRMLSTVLGYLRDAGLAKDIERLPDGAGWRAISRRITADLSRARASCVPFDAPPGWRQIESLGDLWSVGRRMGNCVADLTTGNLTFFRGLVSGQMVFFTTTEQAEGLVAITMLGTRMWTIEEMSGMANRRIPQQVVDDFRGGLTACMARVGHRFVEDDPFAAMTSFLWSARPNPFAEFGDRDAARAA
jgi:hypothetical protein